MLCYIQWNLYNNYNEFLKNQVLQRKNFAGPLALSRRFPVWSILFSQYFADITIDTNIRNAECVKVEVLSQNLLWATGECFCWLTHGLMVFLSLVIFITVATKKGSSVLPWPFFEVSLYEAYLFSRHYFADITIDTNIRNGEFEKVEALSQNLLWATGECFRWLTHGLMVFLSFVIFITVATKKGLQCCGKKFKFFYLSRCFKKGFIGCITLEHFQLILNVSQDFKEFDRCIFKNGLSRTFRIWEAEIHEASDQSIWTSSLTAVCQRLKIVSVLYYILEQGLTYLV